MRVLKYFWLLSIILSFTLTSCNKDDDNENSLEKSYFTIQNATYVGKTIPSGTEALISDIEMNRSAISGGSSIVTLTSTKALSKVYVGIKDFTGYYECPATVSSLRSAQGIYTYEVTLLLSQNLANTPFAVSVSGLAEDGTTSAVTNSDNVSVVVVGTGKLQVSLSWDQLDDVDLHLFEPNGNEIYYGNFFSASDPFELQFLFYCYLVDTYTNHKTSGLNSNNGSDWETLYDYLLDIPSTIDRTKEIAAFAKKNSSKINGYLDLDSNAGCNIDAVNNENITYSNVPDGTYIVAVDLWSKCTASKPGAKYSISVNFDGKPVTISDKQLGKFADSYGGSGNSSEDYAIIGAFTISGNKITPATAPQTLKSSVLKSSTLNKIGKSFFKR